MIIYVFWVISDKKNEDMPRGLQIKSALEGILELSLIIALAFGL